MTLNEAICAVISRVRDPKWAIKEAHLELSILERALWFCVIWGFMFGVVIGTLATIIVLGVKP